MSLGVPGVRLLRNCKNDIAPYFSLKSRLHSFAVKPFQHWCNVNGILQARQSHKRLRVVRLETTADNKRIVGLLVPNAAVETVLQGLSLALSLSLWHTHTKTILESDVENLHWWYTSDRKNKKTSLESIGRRFGMGSRYRWLRCSSGIFACNSHVTAVKLRNQHRPCPWGRRNSYGIVQSHSYWFFLLNALFFGL